MAEQAGQPVGPHSQSHDRTENNQPTKQADHWSPSTR